MKRIFAVALVALFVACDTVPRHTLTLTFNESGDRLTIVADQRGCPTAARDVAGVCLSLGLRCASSPESGPYGLYHFAGGGEATWHEFAKTIIELARFPRPIDVVPPAAVA